MAKQIQKLSSTDPETALRVEIGVILHLPTKTLMMMTIPLFHTVLACLFALKLGLLSQVARALEAEPAEQEAQTRSSLSQMILQMFEVWLPSLVKRTQSLVKQMQKPSSPDPETIFLSFTWYCMFWAVFCLLCSVASCHRQRRHRSQSQLSKRRRQRSVECR